MSTRAPRTPRGDTTRGEAAQPSPLASVVGALKRAGSRGELSDIEIEWSVARLSGKVRRGNPRLDGVDRPDDILRTATEVFRRNGYHHATIDEIANELFLTKAGVYHYFASKQEILEAICDRAMTAAEEAVASGVADGGDPYEQLRLALERYAEALMGQEGLQILLLHVNEISEKGQADIRRRRKALEALLRRVVEDGIRSGVFETDDAQVAVYGMLGAVNWMYSWYVSGGRLPAAKVRDTLVRQSILGVLSRRPHDLPAASKVKPASARRR